MDEHDQVATERIGLSIIICTYNRAPFLDRLLASVERELTDRLDLEILVVDNNCIDNTAEVVRQHQARLPMLRRVVETTQGLSFARNRGVVESTKPHLLYVDDEIVLSEGYIERAEVVLRRFRPDFFGGPTVPYFDRAVPVWFDSADEIRQFERFSGFTRTGSVSGANFGVARRVIERIGAFDTTLGMKGGTMAFGEDRELVERYRSRTPPSQQRVYYAVELTVQNYIMPYKLERKYQLVRTYRNSASRARIMIGTRQRGFTKSALYALGHIVLLPLQTLLIFFDHGLTARGYYKLLSHLVALGGRIRGILEAMTKRGYNGDASQFEIK